MPHINLFEVSCPKVVFFLFSISCWEKNDHKGNLTRKNKSLLMKLSSLDWSTHRINFPTDDGLLILHILQAQFLLCHQFNGPGPWWQWWSSRSAPLTIWRDDSHFTYLLLIFRHWVPGPLKKAWGAHLFHYRDLSAAAEGLCPALGQGSGVKNVFSRPSRKWVTCKWLCPPDSRGFTPRGWEIYWTNTSLLFSIGTVCEVMNFGLSGRVGQETGPGADVSSVVLGMSVRQLLL